MTQMPPASPLAALPVGFPIDVDLLLPDLVRPAATGSGGGREVLVVDDSPIARVFLARRLTLFGYRVHLAANGEQGLAVVEQHPGIGLAFVDLGLGPAPAMDGLRVCQVIRQRERTLGRRTAVVLVSGNRSETVRVRASLAGGDAFLTKPLLEPDFLAVLREADPLFATQAATTPA